MKKAFLITLWTLATIFLIACSNDESISNEVSNVDEPTDTVIEEAVTEEETEEENVVTPEETTPIEESTSVEINPSTSPDSDDPISEMPDHILGDGLTAHYKGEGNEFAELDVHSTRINDIYFVLREDNGGSSIQTILKTTFDSIFILDSGLVEDGDPFPTVQELDMMSPIATYLQLPFALGATFDGWEVIGSYVSVETPYQTFLNAIVIEKVENSTTINRKYFVQGVGEVKREAIMQTSDGEYIVTSSLESIQN
ncbi:hypothetical protein ACXYMX_13415 [Sporosarcina sp. CAU 1771]